MVRNIYKALFIINITAVTAVAQVNWNVDLTGHLNYTQGASDIWGYIGPGGTEYAIIGLYNGTAIIDVGTDPSDPTEVAFISGPNSSWRDIKTHSNYAYVTTEGGGGVQIIDLSDPTNAFLAGTYSATVSSAHNLYIADGYAYIVGNGSKTNVLDLSNPTNPVEVGLWQTEYFHDIFVLDDIGYGAAIYSATIYFIDFSDKANPTTITTFPTIGFTHNTWTNADASILATTDELAGGHIKLYNVSDFNDIQFLSEWQVPNPSSMVHNVIIRGDFAYMAYYTEGLQIVDISDPENPVRAGYYDTYQGGGFYDGAWGVYPFHRYIYISDIQSGLWVLDFIGDNSLKIKGSAGCPGDSGDVVIELTNGVDVDSIHFRIEDDPDYIDLVESQLLIAGYTKTVIDAGTYVDVTLTPDPGVILEPGAHNLIKLKFSTDPTATHGDLMDLCFSDVLIRRTSGDPLGMHLPCRQFYIGTIGDLNADCDVSILDVVMLINIVLEREDPTPYQWWAGDLNADGDFNIFDVIGILNILLN